MILPVTNGKVKYEEFIANVAGKPVFADPVYIDCYESNKEKVVVSDTGVQIISISQFTTTTKIVKQSKLNDRVVLNVDNPRARGMSFYIAYM